jgi:hypothetical protein
VGLELVVLSGLGVCGAGVTLFEYRLGLMVWVGNATTVTLTTFIMTMMMSCFAQVEETGALY